MQLTYSMRKIIPPIVPETILHRSVLVKKLNHTLIKSSQQYKLGLICAPAGYGKSTLLVDFARQSAVPCCWYILDQTDRDQQNFLQNLVASIRHCFPTFGLTLSGLITHLARVEMHYSANTPDLSTVIDAIVEAIVSEISCQFILILCNYHEVNDAEVINLFMDRFIRSLPSFCTILIESRVTPALEYAFLLAQRQLFGLNSSDFRLTPQEINTLASIQGVATPGDAEIDLLIASFDGWIAGILLGTRLGDMQFLQTYEQSQDTQQDSKLFIDQKKLFEYLVHEVFGRKPEMYAFLREAAVLPVMTATLCAALLDTPDAAERLYDLEHQGLFVSHYEEHKQVMYVCHPVLRDIFNKVLWHQDPARFCELHGHAARLAYAEHDYESAMYHALEARATDFVVELIIDVHEQLIAQGYVETVARWIDKLPTHIIALHASLLLIQATVCTILGDQVRALSLLEQVAASPQYAQDSSYLDTRFQAKLAMIQSRALFQAGEYLQSQAVCQELLSGVSLDEFSIHAEAHTLLGISANVQGDIFDGITHLQHALQFRGRETITRHVIDLHGMLASSYSLIGNFALAEHHLSRALALWENVPDEYERVFLLIRMGLIKQRQGAYAEAEYSYSQGLNIARGSIRFRRGEAYALVNLSELYQEQEQYACSLDIIEEGLSLARQIQDTYLIHGTLCTLAMTYMFMGDSSTALLILNQACKIENRLTECMQCKLTRGTILLHLRQYDEATFLIAAAKKAFSETNLKQDLLRSTLRLSACQFALRDDDAGKLYLGEAASQLMVSGDYEQLFRLELKHLPQILSVIRTTNESDPIKDLLQWNAQEERGLSVRRVEGLAISQAPLAPVIETRNDPHISVQAFGEPVVMVDDVPVIHWRRAKAMELCFYLLASNSSVRKEQIIEDLWPESSNLSDQAFRSTVHSLRKVLGERSVVARAGCYSLDLAASFKDKVYYDVATFQKRYEQAKHALMQNDSVQAKIFLHTMIDVYQGEYVQTFYSNWCQFQRDALRGAYLDAHSKLAKIFFQAEQWEESMQYWQQMLAVDHCQEEAHYGLMRCYTRLRKRSMALRQYQQYVQIFQEELSAPPGSAISRLYQRLMETESHHYSST